MFLPSSSLYLIAYTNVMIFFKELYMNLMIVDDHAGMRNLVRQMVVSKFEHVIECSSGEECLQQFQKSPTEWVFMDIQMEGLDGISTTRELKRLFPDTNIVIVTRFDDPDLRFATREAGASGYVLKA
ncbi:MAG: response regulator, partial [Bacteroidetes bacterium]